MNFLVGLQVPSAVGLLTDAAFQKFGCMPYFEGDALRLLLWSTFPGVGSYEVQLFYVQMVLIHFLRVVTVRNEKYVSFYVFLNYRPRSATKTKSFSLTYSVKPQTLVFTYLMTGFYLAHITRVFSEVNLYVITEIYIAQETDSLRIFSFCVK